jgi:hypothetical protein
VRKAMLHARVLIETLRERGNMMHTTHGQGDLVEDVVRIFDRLSEEDPGGAAGGFGSERELAVARLKGPLAR